MKGVVDALIAGAVYHRRLTLALAIAFLVGGSLVASRLKIEAFPDVTNVQVMVIALVPGQAAEEIERKVTIPIERSLVGLPFAMMQRSITSFGLCQVIVTFEDGADIYFARQQVAERLVNAEVPVGVVPSLGPNDTPVGQIYQFTLESPTHDATELRSWQEWTVAKHLSRVAGVADVVSFGGFQKEWHVLADPALMLAHHVTLDDLADAVSKSNGATSGGFIRFGDTEFVVRGRGYLTGPDDIAQTVVRVDHDVPILVRNVANIVQGHTPRRGAVARGLASDSVEGTVLLRRGENPRDVLKALHTAVDELNTGGILPAGMTISPFYDRANLVNTTLTTVSHNMLEGGVLVTLVIYIFLRTWLGALAVAATLPLALLSAFCGLYAVHVPANLLSMGAIDFGILLDGAVILVENIYRHLGHKNNEARHVPDVIIEATREVVRPALFSMCIIIAAMLPIFTLERIEGRIFRPVALTYAFALVGALFFTLTVVPALSCILLAGKKISHEEPQFLQSLRAVYKKVLTQVLAHSIVSRAVAVLILVSACAVVPFLGSEFLPQMNEGDLHITVSMPTTLSLQEGHAALREMRRDLLTFKEVKDVVTEQGHPEDGTDDEAPSQAKTFVILKPPKTWEKGVTPQSLVAAMRQMLEARPGVQYNFSQPIKDRIEEAISGVRGQIVVKIYGEDLALMHGRMREVQNTLRAVRGARDIEVYRAGSAQHVVADIDRNKAARLGLHVDDVEDVIEAAFGGRLATSIWESERKVGVRVKLTTPEEADPGVVARLPVPTPSGYVPLSAVADVHQETGRTQINREQTGRFLALKCNVEGRDMGSFVEEAQARVVSQVKLPEGYRLVWGGEFENQRRAMRQLMIIVPVSLVAIFLLLFGTFGAAMPALVVLCGLPFAAVGGIFALWATHTTLSVSAAIGFITLFGVATMDGVLVITYVRQSRERCQSNELMHPKALREKMVEAVSERLRPVLMTALLASLGLLPAAMSHAIGSDTQRPFAVVIIGGLVSATVLTMVLLPSLYELGERWSARRSKLNCGHALL